MATGPCTRLPAAGQLASAGPYATDRPTVVPGKASSPCGRARLSPSSLPPSDGLPPRRRFSGCFGDFFKREGGEAVGWASRYSDLSTPSRRGGETSPPDTPQHAPESITAPDGRRAAQAGGATPAAAGRRNLFKGHFGTRYGQDARSTEGNRAGTGSRVFVWEGANRPPRRHANTARPLRQLRAGLAGLPVHGCRSRLNR